MSILFFFLSNLLVDTKERTRREAVLAYLKPRLTKIASITIESKQKVHFENIEDVLELLVSNIKADNVKSSCK